VALYLRERGVLAPAILVGTIGVQAIATAPGFQIDQRYRQVIAAEDPLINTAHAHVRRIDLAEVADLSFPAGIRNCYGIPQLRNIDSDNATSPPEANIRSYD
jgi:hypothetical protein